MIRTIKYKNSLHHKFLIQQMLNYHGLHEFLVEDMPKVGYITLDGEQVIAAGFLRLIEGDHAMLDALITNPTVKPEDRDQAIDMLVKALIRRAKMMKIKLIVAFTKDKNTLERSLRHGFVLREHSFISLDLLGE